MSDAKCGNPELLTPEELSTLVNLLPEIEAWLNAVKDRAMELARQDQLPRYKLVTGRSQRKWADEVEALTELVLAGMSADELYIKKFVSVAQAEKQIGKATFRKVAERLVYRTEGKPVLAPLSDKRAAISAAAEFETIKQ